MLGRLLRAPSPERAEPGDDQAESGLVNDKSPRGDRGLCRHTEDLAALVDDALEDSLAVLTRAHLR
jgi:hypothetical protein